MSIRRSPPAAALKSILECLREHRYQSAGHSLRKLVKDHHVPPSLFAEREPTMPLSIAGLGARISLANQELETAVGFLKFIETQSDAQQMSDSTFDVVSGLIDVASPDSLSCAATILTSLPPTKLSQGLVRLFYKASLDQPSLIKKVWSHCKMLPTPEAVVVLLERLVRDKLYSDAINLIGELLKGHDRNSQQLPSGVPIQLVPDLLTYAIRAGATDQCVQIYDQASRQVGALPSAEDRSHSPFTMEQKLFYGNPRMTMALVRHFVRLSEKRPNQLQGWHRSLLQGNPRFFSETAEKVYSAYAVVHGFDKFDLPPNERDTVPVRASHSHITTAVACLFELDRFPPALDLFYTLFEIQEPPDTHDLGIILSSLARRNTGRAIQILLEIAPTRIPGFRPTPHLYSIIIHQSLKLRKMDEAIRLLEHARGAGCGSLDPVVLDDFILASLKDIAYSWKRGAPDSNQPLAPEELKIMTDERLRIFVRIQDAFRILGRKANVPTVRKAIETAIEVRQPRMAWEIRMWGNNVGIFGQRRASISADGEKLEKEQVDEGKSSVKSISRALWSLHQRGLMNESELWFKVRALGIDAELSEGGVEIKEEGGVQPVSLRNQSEAAS
ncbi:hypothetical protein OPQ81_010357 [Rhizoctonia solani]|nr:hypothetical protein OPQ81_010357 [Rhizoctonia solani]